MASGQGRRRRPVEGATRQEGSQRRRRVVFDGARRHVADVPSGLVEAPHEVHVLTAPQVGVEELRARHHVCPNDERRARHERDRAPRPYRSLPGAPVERRTHRLVAGERARRPYGRRRDPGCHGGHQRVVEVAQQRTEPSLGGHAVGVHERHERAVHALQPRVARTRRPHVRRQPDERGAVALGDRLGGARVGGRVVDHDAGQVAQRHEQPVELHRPVPHRHHHGHVFGTERGRHRSRHERAGRHHAPRQQLCRPVRAHGGSRPPAVRDLAGPCRYPEQAQGAAAEEHGATVEISCRRVLDQHERAGERSRRPRRRRAERRRGPGCAGVRHHPILAVRGRR